EIVEAVGERGNCAGELLTARFAPNPGLDPKTKKPIRLTWDNHRWVRYRSFIAALELAARRFHASSTNVGQALPWCFSYGLAQWGWSGAIRVQGHRRIRQVRRWLGGGDIRFRRKFRQRPLAAA